MECKFGANPCDTEEVKLAGGLGNEGSKHAGMGCAIDEAWGAGCIYGMVWPGVHDGGEVTREME